MIPSRVPAIPNKVLVVDDDRVNFAVLEGILRKYGCDSRLVDSESDLFETLERECFDLLLLDAELEEYSKAHCLETLRQRFTAMELPILIVTQGLDRRGITRALRVGANDYIPKPFDEEIVMTRVSTHTQLHRLAAALRDSDERFALATECSHDGIWDWNLTTNKVYYSPRWKALLGFQEDQIGESSDEWLRRVHPEDLEAFQAWLEQRSGSAEVTSEIEVRMLHKDESYRWMQSRAVRVRNAKGLTYRLAGSLSDVTEARIGDPLTGLPNRLLFVDRLERAMERYLRNPDDLFAVMFLDLDDFKQVNDRFGHQAGDRLLIQLAKRLEECLRVTDCVSRINSAPTLARHAGDEFTVLLEGLQTPEDAQVVADRILRATAAPIRIDDHEFRATMSVGWAVMDPMVTSPEDLLRRADAAMYQAKSEGRNRSQQFDLGMQRRVASREERKRELERAFAEREFGLLYQPIFDLHAGRVAGFEALVRWQHPTQGPIPPMEFLHTAADMGLMVPLGWLIAEQACEQSALWTAQYRDRAPFVSLNFSLLQLRQTDFVNQFIDLVHRTGVDAHRMGVEVTESSLVAEPELLRQHFEHLHELGVLITIDDFGTGHSSLSNLHRFPIDMLKIDRSFVSTMTERRESQEIARTIIGLARSLRSRLIAEGVESEEQRDVLRYLGCDLAQGFFWSPPVPAQLAIEFCHSPNPHVSQMWVPLPGTSEFASA